MVDPFRNKVSCRYRSQCRPGTGAASVKVSCRCRSHSVKHVPERSKRCGSRPNRARPDKQQRPYGQNIDSDLHILRADDGIRTRDPHLGKVMLYQLSHVRVTSKCSKAVTPPRPGIQLTALSQSPRAQTRSVPDQRLRSAAPVHRTQPAASDVAGTAARAGPDGTAASRHRGHVGYKTPASEHADVESAHVADSRDVEALRLRRRVRSDRAPRSGSLRTTSRIAGQERWRRSR